MLKAIAKLQTSKGEIFESEEILTANTMIEGVKEIQTFLHWQLYHIIEIKIIRGDNNDKQNIY